MNTIKSFPIALIIVGLTNCGSSGKTVEVQKTSGYQQSHGPFDSNGNYVESWADNAPKRKFTWGRSSSKKPSSKPKTSIAKSSTPKKTYTAPKKSSTPSRSTVTKKTTIKKKPITKKSTARKITPKAKPPISHTVRKGDTLYGLSRRYGASVSAIQKANGLRGNSISIGQRLTIPRR